MSSPLQGKKAFVTCGRRGIGTAIVSLGKLPNGATPVTGTQIVVNVTEPDLSIADMTIGRDLQAPMQVRLANRLPVPATDVTLTMSADFFVGLSNDPATTPNQGGSITVVIPAGQRVSQPR